MNIKNNRINAVYTTFLNVSSGTVFEYQGDYYIRIESIVDNSNGFAENTVRNCIRLIDGTVRTLNNDDQVLILPAELVIN